MNVKHDLVFFKPLCGRLLCLGRLVFVCISGAEAASCLGVDARFGMQRVTRTAGSFGLYI